MNKKVNVIVIICLILVLIISVFCVYNIGYNDAMSNRDLRHDELMRITIGEGGQIYFITLTRDGVLTTETGTPYGYGSDITRTPYMKDIKKSKYEALSTETMTKIVQMAEGIYKSNIEDKRTWATDTWPVKILYKDKEMWYYDYGILPLPVKELVDEIIKQSPIKIEMYGLA